MAVDLSEIPTEDLAKELAKRHDHFACFGVRQPMGTGFAGDELVQFYFTHGNTLTIIGMMERQKHIMLTDADEDAREGTDDD